VTGADRRTAELTAAREGLAEIEGLVAAGRAEYEGNFDRRRALALCWISVGSALKHYAVLAGMPQRHGVLSPAIRLRDKLAHQPVSRLDPVVLWETSVRDTPQLRRIVEALPQGG